MPSLPDSLAAGPIVIDGGLGTLLEHNGHDLSSPLWSARLLAQEQDAIRDAHRQFFDAGARVAITSSYQVGYDQMAAVAGLDVADVDRLLVRSVRLAREARDDAGLTTENAWVAASVGPFGASRADGSEYTGDYDLGMAELRSWHRRRMRTLAAEGPDLIAVETIPSLTELEAVCRELDGLGARAWISVTVAGGALRTGESLRDAFAIAASVPEVLAVGVNCCAVSEIPAALAALRSVTDKPGVVYPNSGEHWYADTRTWSGTAGSLAGSAADWVSGGAAFVGGCCRVGPSEITDIAGRLAATRDASPAPSLD